MSEYIFCVPDENQPIAGDSSLYYPDERDEPMFVREEIVRCCDCKCCDEEHYGAWGRVWHCEQFGDVEPDGFCAWPERSEDA